MNRRPQRRRARTRFLPSSFVERLESRMLLSGDPVIPAVKFVSPIGGVPYKDWTIADYNDVDAAVAGQCLDYHGGPYCFDGHSGIDFALNNFHAQDVGVPVFAVAPGVVVQSNDGEFDRVTSAQGASGNAVVIDHGDGLETLYVHLRKGSVSVHVGDVVAAGQQIGLAASSGNSNGPNVHFGVFLDGVTIETYQDPTRWWANPLPYAGDQPAMLDSGVTNYQPSLLDYGELASEMHNYLPVPARAPDPGPGFDPTRDVHVWGYFKAIDPGDEFSFRFYKPDSTLFVDSTISATELKRTGYFDATLRLPAGTPVGLWQVSINLNNVEMGRESFTVSPVGAPEIRVSDSVNDADAAIIDGRLTPVDFGETPAGGAGATKTFTVNNHGTAPLTTSNLAVPAGFTVTEPLGAVIAPNSSDTFTVRLDGTATTGVRSGKITFTTNDADESAYDFAVEGRVTGGPTAILNAPDLEDAGGTFYEFTVAYTDPDGVDQATLGDNDVTVTGPLGFSAPGHFISAMSDGATTTATYHVDAPGGFWDASDWGPYEISLHAGAVADTTGHASLPAALGGFNASMPLLGVDNQNIVAFFGTYAPDTLTLSADAQNVYFRLNDGNPFFIPRDFVSGVAMLGFGGDDTFRFEGGAFFIVGVNGGVGHTRIVVDTDAVAFATDAGAQNSDVSVELYNDALLFLAENQNWADLSVGPGASLDLLDNDLAIHASAANRQALQDRLAGYLKTGRNNGDWLGFGIGTSAAMDDPSQAAGIAMRINDRGNGTPLLASFAGKAVDANTLLLKYSYEGDTDFNGRVNIDDFFNADLGRANGLTGYARGDVNYSGGAPDGDDYFIFDKAFLAQGAPLSAAGSASPFAISRPLAEVVDDLLPPPGRLPPIW